jgi:hypothetical protein
LLFGGALRRNSTTGEVRLDSHFFGNKFFSSNRKDGTKVVTRVKKVTGDTALFLQELRTTLNLPAPANGLASYDSIRIRTGGAIEVKGNRAREIRDWLAGLGF